tara:strand:- start:170 stop:1078 length:909 start_codon:yes stop_codon:yes gene_type:complete
MKKIAIVDSHHHLWDLESKETYYPWLCGEEEKAFYGSFKSIKKNYLLVDYLNEAKNQNLVKSIHVQAEHDDRNPIEETKWLQNISDNNKLKIPNGIVAFADFSKETVSEILDQHLDYKNVRGIRQILSFDKDKPQYSHAKKDYLKDRLWIDNFKHISRRKLSFDIQMYPHQFDDACKLAKRYSNVLFILNHTGEPCFQTEEYKEYWVRKMKSLAENDNFVCKISGLGMFNPYWTINSTKFFVLKTIEIFGINRCMFGSNFPVDKIFNTFNNYWDSYFEITKSFSQNELNKIYSKNALKFYRI